MRGRSYKVDAIGTIGAGNPDAGSNSVPDVVPRVEDKAEWFVLRTQARHEKCVAERARSRQVESFLPLYRSVRYWKDRRKELELPLFPGYVFVRTSIAERRPILQVPGVLQFITCNGQPTPVPDAEVDALRRSVTSTAAIEPFSYLTTGRRVRVRGGPLAGITGILVAKKRQLRVVLSIELIQQSVAVEVDACDLEPIA